MKKRVNQLLARHDLRPLAPTRLKARWNAPDRNDDVGFTPLDLSIAKGARCLGVSSRLSTHSISRFRARWSNPAMARMRRLRKGRENQILTISHGGRFTGFARTALRKQPRRSCPSLYPCHPERSRGTLRFSAHERGGSEWPSVICPSHPVPQITLNRDSQHSPEPAPQLAYLCIPLPSLFGPGPRLQNSSRIALRTGLLL